MSSELPPQRLAPAGGGAAAGRNLSPQQGALESERKTGRPCYHAGQVVAGLFQCVSCRFQIRNRKRLPACPDCGELIWAYMEDGPRPVPEGESAPAPAAQGAAPAGPAVEENVRIQATPVRVEENVKLEP
ncbi:MAG: hypothetical protein AB1416_11910 [Actinomycetota bacterium]